MGVVTIAEALRIAEERGLDVVEVSPQAVPPVCKIQNYDKLRYERKKQAEKARKMTKKQELKEIRLTPNTGENDIQIKVNQATKFLEAGDKVSVSIKFMGREITHPQLGKDILQKVKEGLRNVAVVESAPMFERRKLFMIFKPAVDGDKK